MIFTSILILIVAMALPSFNKSMSPNLLVRISSIVFIYTGVLVLNTLYIQSIGSGIGIYSGLFQVSNLSQFMEMFTLIIGSFVLLSWLSVIKTTSPIHQNKNYASEYSIVVLFSTLGACLLISSSDLISMYLSIELQSFGVYILSTLYRDSESSTSAGLKYFLLGGLSSCLILLGSGLIYSYTGLTNLESIYSLISVNPFLGINEINNITQGINLGFILIIVGFLFKIAAAPLHNWAPDVYDDTPTIVTIWLTIMPKISIIIFLIEVYTHIGLINIPSLLEYLNTQNTDLINNVQVSTLVIIKNLLLITSLFSLIIGTVVGLAQSKIKRLLAYSTISHIGFILLALAINSEQSIDSLIFYIIQYSITNLNTFLIILAFGLILNKNTNNSSLTYIGSEKDIKYINQLKGQFFSNPLLTISLSICLFSMAGIPPLIGFFSKQFVLYSAIQSGYYFMAILGIIVSIISASYYLKIIRVLHTESTHSITSNEDKAVIAENRSEENMSKESNDFILSNVHTYLISSLSLIILFFILKPSIILNITRLLSLAIFNY